MKDLKQQLDKARAEIAQYEKDNMCYIRLTTLEVLRDCGKSIKQFANVAPINIGCDFNEKYRQAIPLSTYKYIHNN